MAKAKCDECLNTFRILNKLVEFLCNDCEKYLCSKCITKHVDHLTFALKDKSNKTILDSFCADMMKQLISEGDQTLEKFTQERTHICDVVDVVEGNNTDFSVKDICILRENKRWAITDWNYKCIKVFNINNNNFPRTIHLAYSPYGITEIPSTDPSLSLIAVSSPDKEQIDIMNINSDPAQVISSINVHDRCLDLAYCNNKFSTMCGKHRNGEWCGSIHVMDMSGEIINIIDLNRLPGIQLIRGYVGKMCVHYESETIYVCQYDGPPCVTSLSIDGQVLHFVKFTDLKPCLICVDRDQAVYLKGHNFPLYKLSSDLSQKEQLIDEGVVDKRFSHFTAIACHADTFYIVMSVGHVVIMRHE